MIRDNSPNGKVAMRQRETRGGRRGYWMLGLAFAAAVVLGLGHQSAAANEPAGAPPFDIFAMQANGSQQTDLTNEPAEDTHATWSPDGSKIAYARAWFDWEIYVMNADGSGQTDLTNDSSADDYDPSWSPDGTQIAFVRASGSDSDLYVINVDGTGLT